MKARFYFIIYFLSIFQFFSSLATSLIDYQTSCGPITKPFHITTSMQNGGSMYVAGYYVNDSGIKQMIMGRLKADGTNFDEDNSFGVSYFPTQGEALLSGYVVVGYDTNQQTSFKDLDIVPVDMGFDVAGNILVIGHVQDQSNSSNPQDGFIARFTSAGVLDTDFNNAATVPGFLQFDADTFGITQPDVPAVQNGITLSGLAFDSDAAGGPPVTTANASRYLFTFTSTDQLQSGVIAISDGYSTGGAPAAGVLDNTFNGQGYQLITNTDLDDSDATKTLSFLDIASGNNGTDNMYYCVGSFSTDGIVLALPQDGGDYAVEDGFALENGFLTIKSTDIGSVTVQNVVFKHVTQDGDEDPLFITAEFDGNAAIVSVLSSGAGLNSGISPTGSLGDVPGVMLIEPDLIGQTASTMTVDSFSRKATTGEFYMSGLVGASPYILSILANGSGLNTAFGNDGTGYTIFDTSDFATQGDSVSFFHSVGDVYDPTAVSFVLYITDGADTKNNSAVVRVPVQATGFDTSYNATGIAFDFEWTFNYYQHLIVEGTDKNIHVTTRRVPTGQIVQLLLETDDPLLPPVTQVIALPREVITITDAIYSEENNTTVVVGTRIGAINKNHVGFIARFTQDLIPDVTFNASGTPGYKIFNGGAIGEDITKNVLFMSVAADATEDYYIGGSFSANAMVTKILHNGTGFNTTFNSGGTVPGVKQFTSADLGGTGDNALITDIIMSSQEGGTFGQVYFLAHTDDTAESSPIRYGVDPTEISSGSSLSFCRMHKNTGSIVSGPFIIDATTLDQVGNVPELQAVKILQESDTANFFIVMNLPSSSVGGTTTGMSAIAQVKSDLSNFVTTGFGQNGIAYFDSSNFGIDVTGSSLAYIIGGRVLSNNNLFLVGYASKNYSLQPIVNVAMQLTEQGGFNQRFNDDGWYTGGQSSSEQGYMTSFAGGVVAILGRYGGIFNFGEGSAAASRNKIELALRRRYGL